MRRATPQMNRRAVWDLLQHQKLSQYREYYAKEGNLQGFFSVDGHGSARRVGKIITDRCDTCLDVGSGVLPRPVYMSSGMRFIGIDPFQGEWPRQYAFARAIGEHLPFRGRTFPCVSFMSSLDHQIDPVVSLREAHRVLQSSGQLFLWVTLRVEDDRYLEWKAAAPGTLFNYSHQYAFVFKDIEGMMQDAGFQWIERHDFARESWWPPTQLIIGRKL